MGAREDLAALLYPSHLAATCTRADCHQCAMTLKHADRLIAAGVTIAQPFESSLLDPMRSAVHHGPGTYLPEGWHALCARLLAAADQLAGRPEGVTVTEWRINGPEGPSYAIDTRHPEAEKWSRRVAAADYKAEGTHVEFRDVTTYPPVVGEWTRAPEQETIDART